MLLTSCEGFKVLTILNTSDHEVRVTVRPGIDSSDHPQINDYPNRQTSNSSMVILRPDSSMTVLSVFTGMMFNVKIKERELRTDYIKIETPTNTVIAASKEEIIDLIYAKRKGAIKGEGRNFATIKIE
jgi:hypothetical protein